jgi:uncharacterized protein (TIGR02217 family)
MTIPAYRLPPEIEIGASGGPDFKTIIQESVSGIEQRIITWSKCRARYDIAYAVLNSTDATGNYRKVYSLFLAHRGKAQAFRFKAWNDYTATNESFGTGDGAATQFQLIKTYDPGQLLLGSPGVLTYSRDILMPISTGLVIKVSGTPTSAYTLNAGGVIVFDSAPANAAPLTWTGEFDLPMRFDTDHLPVVMNANEIVNISSIPLRELISEF